MTDNDKGYLTYTAPTHVGNKNFKETDEERNAHVQLHNTQFKFVFTNVAEEITNRDLKNAVDKIISI